MDVHIQDEELLKLMIDFQNVIISFLCANVSHLLYKKELIEGIQKNEVRPIFKSMHEPLRFLIQPGSNTVLNVLITPYGEQFAEIADHHKHMGLSHMN